MAEDKPREIKISIPLPDELLSQFLPVAAFEHLLQAKKETLLALRALIDSRIEALGKKKNKKPATKKKIKIE